MEIIVMGAGVVGLSTAYALACDGHQVTVVDRAGAVAHDASHANGGQLSYSYVAPLASPATLRALPRLLLQRDSPVRFAAHLERSSIAWGLRFLLSCNRQSVQRTTKALLELTTTSRRLVHRLIEKEAINFAFRRTGKLVVYSDARAFADTKQSMRRHQELGFPVAWLTRDECLALEPALTFMAHEIAGGVFSSDDETGDCELFCQELHRVLRDHHRVRFELDTRITSLRRCGTRITSICTDRGEMRADVFVLALGCGSRTVAATVGLRLPIIGLKGYSLTLPATGNRVPRISVTDVRRRIVYAPLGSWLRVAGIADIDTDDERFRPERVELIRRQARSAFPHDVDHDAARVWMGVRPATPSGRPIVGQAPAVDNLHLNVGHGGLGFTLAMATGHMVATQIGPAA